MRRDGQLQEMLDSVDEGGAVAGGAVLMEPMMMEIGLFGPGLRLNPSTKAERTVAVPLMGKGTAALFGIWKAKRSPEAWMCPLVAIARRMPKTNSAALGWPEHRAEAEKERVCAGRCVGARRHPGRWTRPAGNVLGLAPAAVAASWIVQSVVHGPWTAAGSLPLPLCDVALVVAAIACWWPHPLLVELTWFLGLAGTLQAVITPDLEVRFPHLVFFQYVTGHLGIVVAALYLVVGLGMTPRPGAVWRTFTITVAYTALVGAVDGVTGGDYMFLRSPPATWTLLSVPGPWP